MTWQPIETAPKDGTEVLILFDSVEVRIVHLCYWHDGQDLANEVSYPDTVGWWYFVNSVSQIQPNKLLTATHWCEYTPPTN